MTVGGHAQHRDIKVSERGELIVELTGFFCASRRVVGRIEVENDALAREVLQGHLLIVLVTQSEGRGAIAPAQAGHVVSYAN
jgi:hypothetical protein